MGETKPWGDQDEQPQFDFILKENYKPLTQDAHD